MERTTEFKRCKCGHVIIVYKLSVDMEYVPVGEVAYKPTQYRYFDAHSGNHDQCFVCPECHIRLDYKTLEG